MKIRYGILFLCFIGIAFTSALFGEERNDEWKKIKEADGISCYSRPTSKSSINELKAEGAVDSPVAVIEAVIRDIPAQPEFMFMCAEAYKVDIPGYQNTGDIRHFYNRTDMPWPVADRFFIGRSHAMIDREKGIVYLTAHSIACEFKVEDKTMVRMPIVEARWVLKPSGKDRTEVTYQVLGDPGGRLPAFLVNMITNDMGLKAIQGLRNMVKKEKYRNVKTIVTQTPFDGKAG